MFVGCPHLGPAAASAPRHQPRLQGHGDTCQPDQTCRPGAGPPTDGRRAGGGFRGERVGRNGRLPETAGAAPSWSEYQSGVTAAAGRAARLFSTLARPNTCQLTAAVGIPNMD